MSFDYNYTGLRLALRMSLSVTYSWEASLTSSIGAVTTCIVHAHTACDSFEHVSPHHTVLDAELVSLSFQSLYACIRNASYKSRSAVLFSCECYEIGVYLRPLFSR